MKLKEPKCENYERDKTNLAGKICHLDMQTNEEQLKIEFFKKFGYSVKSSRAITTGFSNEIADWWLNKLSLQKQQMIEKGEGLRKNCTARLNELNVSGDSYVAGITDYQNLIKKEV